MSGFARIVGTAASAIASVATFIPGGQDIAAIAGAIALGAGITGQLAAKSPIAQGQVNSRTIGANNRQPYIMGRDYSPGLTIHDVGYGGEVDDVNNPYLFLATAHSCAGPLDGFENLLADFEVVPLSGTAATGYYAGWLWCDVKLGARPETEALSPHWSGTPAWGSAYKLSSWAQMGLSLRFDREGERFPGGQTPELGAIWRGVRVYDPRLDSTYPGGSGSCTLGDESTYVYSTDPALHAGMYAYGRFVEGKRVFGIGLGDQPAMWADVVAWANLNDARNWSLGGRIYEPGDKWNNIKVICQAGGAKPVPANGTLRFYYHAPRIAIGTIGLDDLAEGGVRGGRTRRWKERHNTIVPRFRSEDHQWEYVQGAEASVAAFVAADGEEKRDEIQYDLVTDSDQSTQLAAYEVWDRREKGPFVIPCKPHMRVYQLGDCLTLKAEVGCEAEDIKVLVRRKRYDFARARVMLTVVAETDAKHADALGRVGAAPSVPYRPTLAELDGVFRDNTFTPTGARNLVSPADPPITATANQIDIAAFNGLLDGSLLVEFPAGTISSLTSETFYAVLWDIAAETYSAVAYPATTELADTELALLTWITTAAAA